MYYVKMDSYIWLGFEPIHVAILNSDYIVLWKCNCIKSKSVITVKLSKVKLY
jgi:hypothetical protein